MTEMDIAPEFDFTAASRDAEARALEAAGITPTPDEQPPAPEPDQPEPPPDQPPPAAEGEQQQTLEEQPQEQERPERRRDEQGRFLPEDDGPFLGTYRTREAAEAGIAEKDRYIQELTERNRQYEEYLRQQQEAAQAPPLTAESFEDLVETAPDQALDLAWRRGDQRAYEYAWRQWDEQYPGGPRMWLATRQAEARAAELEQRFQSVQAPFEEQQNTQAWQQSIVQFSEQNPWFQQLQNEEIMSAAERNPIVARMLEQSNDHNVRVAALRTLGLDALQARGAISAEIQDVARTQAQEAEHVRNEAFTASPTTATAQTPATPEQAEKERTEALWAEEQNKWQSGWERPEALNAEMELLRLRQGGRAR